MTAPEMFHPFEVTVPYKDIKDAFDVQVVNLRKEIAPAPALTELRTLVTTATKELDGLQKSDWWTIAHAVADPGSLAASIKSGNTIDEYSGESVLTFVQTPVTLTSLFPLVQPRTAHLANIEQPPRVLGATDSNTKPTASMIVEFRDEDHLRDHLASVFRGTMKAGSDLRASILSHGVTQPVLCYSATIRLLDSDEEIDVLAVADGITRVTRSWQAIFGAEYSERDLPDFIVRQLLTQKGAKTNTDGSSSTHRKGRASVYSDIRGRFQSAAQRTSDPDLTRVGQALRLPGRIVVGYKRLTADLVGDSIPFEFPDAINSAVAQQHTLSKGWDPSAIGTNVMAQAVQRAAAEGKLARTVAEVALGFEDFEFSMADSENVDREIDSMLARATWLTAVLSEPNAHKAIKQHLRSLLAKPQIQPRDYADKLATVVERPWTSVKEASRSNAVRAWRAGGPIPWVLYREPWVALMPRKYADLVPVALDDSHPHQRDALATLQVAGGIALTADGLLLAASGSTAEGGYKRVQPHGVVKALSESPERLWVLAHAADSFKHDREAVNSFTNASAIPSGCYLVDFPSPTDPEVPTGKFDGKRLDYKAIQDAAGLKEEQAEEQSAEPRQSHSETLTDFRTKLATSVERAKTYADLIEDLLREHSELQPLYDASERHDWEVTKQSLGDLFAKFTFWAPSDELVEELEDEDDDLDDNGDEDEDEDEEQ
ncbi:hypothetical protein [Rhodococcus sp. NPDC006774]|uniref:hypothetical protein n=1 Tax=Rhodococcus sp. NPDC006774 TaxID=3157186 RepID=UPI0033D4B1A1